MSLRCSLAACLLCLTSGLSACGAAGDGAPLDGEQVFLAYCAACHGADGSGTYQGPDIVWGITSLSVEEVIEVVENGRGDMDPVALIDAEADNVADYVVNVLRASVSQ